MPSAFACSCWSSVRRPSALATFHLAVCLEKLDQADEARKEYENYLKILPHGPLSDDARKAIDRLKGTAANAKPSK